MTADVAEGPGIHPPLSLCHGQVGEWWGLLGDSLSSPSAGDALRDPGSYDPPAEWRGKRSPGRLQGDPKSRIATTFRPWVLWTPTAGANSLLAVTAGTSCGGRNGDLALTALTANNRKNGVAVRL